MTSSYYSYEEEWDEDEWPAAVIGDSIAHAGSIPVELALIIAVILVAAALGWGALGLISHTGETAVARPSITVEERTDTSSEQPIPLPLSNPNTIIAPYDEYILTQGLHGMSYGHMAIDIAAGKGAAIKSPVTGIVSEHYFDAIGNPTLVIENDRYKVTLLHGIYKVGLGDKLSVGDEIGTESNLGNTRDMQGQSCRGRDCGYHTHLNIFDKIAGSNINPLDVIGN
jgi:murein DD-endopeptidase MepM/ murein hydrolase activator NlpD